jgi:hypothetical protein
LYTWLEAIVLGLRGLIVRLLLIDVRRLFGIGVPAAESAKIFSGLGIAAKHHWLRCLRRLLR